MKSSRLAADDTSPDTGELSMRLMAVGVPTTEYKNSLSRATSFLRRNSSVCDSKKYSASPFTLSYVPRQTEPKEGTPLCAPANMETLRSLRLEASSSRSSREISVEYTPHMVKSPSRLPMRSSGVSIVCSAPLSSV